MYIYSLCCIDGYIGHHTHRTSSRGGGVSIFCASEFQSFKIESLCFCDETIESCVVQVNTKPSPVFIVGVYRPHTDTENNFILRLESLLSHELLRNKLIIFTGDININLNNSNLNATTEYVNSLNSMHFIPIINIPTRLSTNAINSPGTNLDHIWVNKIIPYFSGVLKYDLTDHCPVFFHFKFSVSNYFNLQQKISFRPYSESNFTSLCTELSSVNWDNIINDNIDESYDSFVNTINNLYCKNFPIKTKQIPTGKKKNRWLIRMIECFHTNTRNRKHIPIIEILDSASLHIREEYI